MLHFIARILGWFIGLRFAEDNFVAPILRSERFYRVAGPGFFWVNLFTERMLPPVDIGVRFAPFHFTEVVSQDNIPFTVRMTVLFAFNPERANKETIARLVRLPAQDLTQTLQAVVQDHTCSCLYSLASKFQATDLRGHTARVNIKRNLITYLRNHLQGLGLSFGDDGVLIKEIIADERFKYTMLHVEQHRETLEALSKYHQEDPNLVDKAVQAELLDSLESHQGAINIGARFGLDYPPKGGRQR